VPASVPPAVVTFGFDPFLRLGQIGIRWETVGIAAAILVTLVVGGLIAGRTPREGGGGRLRRDDLLFVALGATPGAVVGGRLGYVLLHLDYFVARPDAIADPAAGGLELSLAVAGGVLTGLVVATLLDGSGRRWAHAAAVPLLGGLGLGKAALALGGSGQGQPSDVGWATAYGGVGPWGSLAPAVPSHPAQLYESLGYVLALLVVGLAVAAGIGARRDGRLLGLALVLIALVRLTVAFTWRDGTLAGPFRAEHLLALGPLTLGIAAWVAFGRESTFGDRRAQDDEPAWPDPSVADRWRARTNGR
jgi:phosphatidylglycerol---prolipoprotein diacylglyceryl transferase